MPRRQLLDAADPATAARLAAFLEVPVGVARAALADLASGTPARTTGAERTARWRARKAEPPVTSVTESVTSVTEPVTPASVTTVTERVTKRHQSVTRNISAGVVRASSTKEQVKNKDQEQQPRTENSAGAGAPAPAPKKRAGRPRRYPNLPPDFLAPYAEAWVAAYPGSHFFGAREAGAVAALEQQHGHDESLRRFRNMCAAKPASVASAHLLRRAWPEFALSVSEGGAQARPTAQATPGQLAARGLWRVFLDYGVLTCVPDAFHRLLARMEAEGAITDARAFMGVVRVLDFPTLKRCTEARWAERHIEERAGHLLTPDAPAVLPAAPLAATA